MIGPEALSLRLRAHAALLRDALRESFDGWHQMTRLLSDVARVPGEGATLRVEGDEAAGSPGYRHAAVPPLDVRHGRGTDPLCPHPCHPPGRNGN